MEEQEDPAKSPEEARGEARPQWKMQREPETEVAACWAAPAVLAAVSEEKGLHLLRPAAAPLGANGGCLHACRSAG